MKLVIYLSSEVESFNIAAVVESALNKEFPGLEIHTADTYESMLVLLPGTELLITWRLSPEDFGLGTELKAIFTPAAGRDWVTPMPGVHMHYGSFHGAMIGESLLAMILFFNNQLDQAFAGKNKRSWNRNNNQRPRKLLRDQQALIIGYGNVGRHIAGQLRGLGMGVAGLRRRNIFDLDSELTRMVQYESIEAELSIADHVILLLPSGPETDGWFRNDFFEAMQRTACLYSLGRGNCLDEVQLAANLKAGNIAGAGLDVFNKEPLGVDSPLWDLNNLIITPHNSCCYDDYGPLFARELTGALSDFLKS